MTPGAQLLIILGAMIVAFGALIGTLSAHNRRASRRKLAASSAAEGAIAGLLEEEGGDAAFSIEFLDEAGDRLRVICAHPKPGRDGVEFELSISPVMYLEHMRVNSLADISRIEAIRSSTEPLPCVIEASIEAPFRAQLSCGELWEAIGHAGELEPAWREIEPVGPLVNRVHPKSAILARIAFARGRVYTDWTLAKAYDESCIEDAARLARQLADRSEPPSLEVIARLWESKPRLRHDEPHERRVLSQLARLRTREPAIERVLQRELETGSAPVVLALVGLDRAWAAPQLSVTRLVELLKDKNSPLTDVERAPLMELIIEELGPSALLMSDVPIRFRLSAIDQLALSSFSRGRDREKIALALQRDPLMPREIDAIVAALIAHPAAGGAPIGALSIVLEAPYYAEHFAPLWLALARAHPDRLTKLDEVDDALADRIERSAKARQSAELLEAAALVGGRRCAAAIGAAIQGARGRGERRALEGAVGAIADRLGIDGAGQLSIAEGGPSGALTSALSAPGTTEKK